MQTPIYRIIKIRKFWRKAGHSWLCETRESIIYMRLEIFGTYDFLFVSDGINRKNKKKNGGRLGASIFVTWSILLCLTDNEDLFHTWCIHLLTLMLLLLYLSALLDNIMDSYGTCLRNLTVCILSGLILLRPTQMTYIFFYLVYTCMPSRLQDDGDLFQTYVIATVLAVRRRYWTMLWIRMLPAFGILSSLCWVD